MQLQVQAVPKCFVVNTINFIMETFKGFFQGHGKPLIQFFFKNTLKQ